MREQFEKKYREMHPDDKCTLMPNGNYSGWMKQARWDGWQMRQAEVDHLIEMNKRYIGKMQEQQDQIAELKATTKKSFGVGEL